MIRDAVALRKLICATCCAMLMKVDMAKFAEVIKAANIKAEP